MKSLYLKMAFHQDFKMMVNSDSKDRIQSDDNYRSTPVKLKQLLSPWVNTDFIDCDVQNLQNDSRLIQAGDLFLAYPGTTTDGRLYIDKAIASGAAAVVYDDMNFSLTSMPTSAIPCVAMPHLGHFVSQIAQRFFYTPGQPLTITGITGTNGKTTIAYQLAQAYGLLSEKSAYIGTIGQGDVNHLQPLANTTPDGLCLQRLMAHYKADGTRRVCMEVSSHALSQHRVDAIEFEQAIFTNLTLDHLDYHHTMQEYAAAKALLFARPELKWAIINHDDPYQQQMSDAILSHVKKITYGLQPGCDVRAVDWKMNIQGTRISVASPLGDFQYRINSIGRFNIYNSLAILASLMVSGYTKDKIIEVMGQLKPAPGRMEIVSHSPYVLVDYAHTPDALENALSTLEQLKTGQLWVVFGCGGDRDKSKRPVMGKAAGLYADHIVITSDNPRSEEPQLIVDEIAKGIHVGKAVIKQVNREDAISFALSHAQKEDIILIAGKGHEAYQQIGLEKHFFSDQEVVRRLKEQMS